MKLLLEAGVDKEIEDDVRKYVLLMSSKIHAHFSLQRRKLLPYDSKFIPPVRSSYLILCFATSKRSSFRNKTRETRN
jgi:hypothetical protein